MSNESEQKIFQLIDDSHYPLLISHEKPDGDTLGASLALSNYLAKKDIRHRHFCPDKPADYFNYLPRIEHILTDPQTLNLAEHDLVIAIDCADLKRTGLSQTLELHKDRLILINIDHHYSNDHYGHHNLVKADASSASEIIYQTFKQLNIEIDKYIATCILTGILTDTMNFTNAATTKDSLKIAGQLLSQGARVNKIISQINQNKNLAALKLWGEALSRLIYNPEYNCVYTVITSQDLTDSQISFDEAHSGLANFLSSLKNIDFILVLTEEQDGWVKGSLRTTKDNVDVALLAKAMGGGGHKKAAGFKVPGHLVKTPAGWQIA